jgi:hypothetical protein
MKGRIVILALLIAVFAPLTLSGCLNGDGDDGNGGGGGYGITYPVADLILSVEELPGWNVISSTEYMDEVGEFEDVAAVIIIDTENLTSAEHYITISLFEINSTEDSEAAYQLIKQEYENQTTVNVIDVGTEGFWADINGTVHMIFTKYRYITFIHYQQMGPVSLSINELVDIAEEQAENLVYIE